jgi:hypothetical protein
MPHCVNNKQIKTTYNFIKMLDFTKSGDDLSLFYYSKLFKYFSTAVMALAPSDAAVII